MSVTFSLPSQEIFYPACPACGGKINYDPQPAEDCAHPSCQGYGPDRVESVPSLNLANRNARVLLTEVLQLEAGELWGEIDAQELKVALATASLRIGGATIEPSQHRNVITGGLSVEQITRYLDALEVLAELGARRGEAITFG